VTQPAATLDTGAGGFVPVSTNLQKQETLKMNAYRDPAIFGGVILSYIDMAGAIEAHRRTRMDRFVTVAMREVIFHKPVFVGDLVSFYAETVSIGNTSITIRVVVETERVNSSVEQVRVTEAEVVYVAVDENRVKTQIKSQS
jgi:acyl-CoA thioesterase YciA